MILLSQRELAGKGPADSANHEFRGLSVVHGVFPILATNTEGRNVNSGSTISCKGQLKCRATSNSQ
jgi:hypothetical protein